MPKRILIAPDKFKNSLTAIEVAQAIAFGINRTNPSAHIQILPIADGGEGTSELFEVLGFQKTQLSSYDALGREIKTFYLQKSNVAVVELAKSAGIELISSNGLDPMKASTFGTGIVIKDAIEAGIKEIILTLGGSATVDGGIGILSALGFKLKDSHGEVLTANGKNLSQVREVIPPANNFIKDTKFVILCDVTNPLLGEMGAAKVFGPQKGATPAMVEELENGLANLAEIFTHSDPDLPGMGAAGGVAFSLSQFFKVEILSGIEFLVNQLNLIEAIKNSDLLITGEGKFDDQSLLGKGPYYLAQIAKEHRKKSILVCGLATVESNIFESIYQLATIEPDINKSISNAGEILNQIGEKIGENI